MPCFTTSSKKASRSFFLLLRNRWDFTEKWLWLKHHKLNLLFSTTATTTNMPCRRRSWFLYIYLFFCSFRLSNQETPTSWHDGTCCGKPRFKPKIYGLWTYKSFFTQCKSRRNFVWYLFRNFRYKYTHLCVIFTSNFK